MELYAPPPQVREDGDFDVHVNASGGTPFAAIYLSEAGASRITYRTLADADRLIRAAVESKRKLEAYLSGGHHEYDPAGTSRGCDRCGTERRNAIHDVPAGPCSASGCGHAKAAHWEHAEPDGKRAGCAFLGCECTRYVPDAAAVLAGPVANGTPAGDVAAAMCDSTLPLKHGGELACELDDGHEGGHEALRGTRRWTGDRVAALPVFPASHS